MCYALIECTNDASEIKACSANQTLRAFAYKIIVSRLCHKVTTYPYHIDPARQIFKSRSRTTRSRVEYEGHEGQPASFAFAVAATCIASSPYRYACVTLPSNGTYHGGQLQRPICVRLNAQDTLNRRLEAARVNKYASRARRMALHCQATCAHRRLAESRFMNCICQHLWFFPCRISCIRLCWAVGRCSRL